MRALWFNTVRIRSAVKTGTGGVAGMAFCMPEVSGSQLAWTPTNYLVPHAT